MRIDKHFEFYDKFRKCPIKNITTLKFDRDGNVILIVYLDKKIHRSDPINESDKYYCNEFSATEVSQ